MEKIKHGDITTFQITQNIWVAKTKTLEPLKAEFEMKGNSEINAYEKLLKFLGSIESPERVHEAQDGSKIYYFKIAQQNKNNQ